MKPARCKRGAFFADTRHVSFHESSQRLRFLSSGVDHFRQPPAGERLLGFMGGSRWARKPAESASAAGGAGSFLQLGLGDKLF